LTQGMISHYMERVGARSQGSSMFGDVETVSEVGQPDWGNFFTHLLELGVSFRIFGEAAALYGGAETPDGRVEQVADHVDFAFPGLFYNMNIQDEEKMEYVISYYEAEGLPQFSYILIPNDHTFGLRSDKPTPESMVSDNDYATGLLIDYLSHRDDWGKTAVFIVEDDPQGGSDHIDRNRSIMVVASAWARRGHTSHVLTSNPSLFKTFELILGIPPMHRYDAVATPLWDAFTTEPDLTPFEVRSRQIPDQLNSEVDREKSSARGLEVARRWSEEIDFGGPDRCEDLQDIVAVARLGGPPPGSRLDRVLRGELPDTGPDVEEEELEEVEMYDRAWHIARHYLRRHPEQRALLRQVEWPEGLEP
ncbi:MAG: alkaline phosphatase family protein, partial [Myxococcota bacterium]